MHININNNPQNRCKNSQLRNNKRRYPLQSFFFKFLFTKIQKTKFTAHCKEIGVVNQNKEDFFSPFFQQPLMGV